MIKCTIEFSESEVEYYTDKTPFVIQTYLSAIANGYDIDKTLLYHIYDIGYNLCLFDLKRKENHA